jgi:large subunit ribosomal protein L29
MDIKAIRALSDAELRQELSNAKRNLYDLRFQLATRQLDDYSQIALTRRRIARILTVMTERQAEGAGAARATVAAAPAASAEAGR